MLLDPQVAAAESAVLRAEVFRLVGKLEANAARRELVRVRAAIEALPLHTTDEHVYRERLLRAIEPPTTPTAPAEPIRAHPPVSCGGTSAGAFGTAAALNPGGG